MSYRWRACDKQQLTYQSTRVDLIWLIGASGTQSNYSFIAMFI